MDDNNILAIMKAVADVLGWTGGKDYQTVVNQITVRGNFSRGEKGYEVKNVGLKVKSTTDFYYRTEE